MSETVWYYTVNGSPAFYRNTGEKYLYTPTGRCELYEENGYWYRTADGQVAYYLDGDRKWVYTTAGQPAFYRG